MYGTPGGRGKWGTTPGGEGGLSIELVPHKLIYKRFTKIGPKTRNFTHHKFCDPGSGLLGSKKGCPLILPKGKMGFPPPQISTDK